MTEKLRRINPMVLSYPGLDSYPKNCFEPPNLHYQTWSSKTFSLWLYTITRQTNLDDKSDFKICLVWWWCLYIIRYFWRYNQRRVTENNCEGLSQWVLVTLLTNFVPTTLLYHKHFTTIDGLDWMALPLQK